MKTHKKKKDAPLACKYLNIHPYSILRIKSSTVLKAKLASATKCIEIKIPVINCKIKNINDNTPQFHNTPIILGVPYKKKKEYIKLK